LEHTRARLARDLMVLKQAFANTYSSHKILGSQFFFLGKR
jgi:hypothetical protein